MWETFVKKMGYNSHTLSKISNDFISQILKKNIWNFVPTNYFINKPSRKHSWLFTGNLFILMKGIV